MTGKKIDWHGVFVVSATPFTEDGAIDEDAFRALMRHFRRGRLARRRRRGFDG